VTLTECIKDCKDTGDIGESCRDSRCCLYRGEAEAKSNPDSFSRTIDVSDSSTYTRNHGEYKDWFKNVIRDCIESSSPAYYTLSLNGAEPGVTIEQQTGEIVVPVNTDKGAFTTTPTVTLTFSDGYTLVSNPISITVIGISNCLASSISAPTMASYS
jgi:hypothetical protein